MAALAELVKKLAEKSGVDINTEEFKAVLEGASKIELPENTDLLASYILKTDAKNDPEIKSHFYGQFANQFDSAVFKSFEEIGIGRDALDELRKNEPSSFKRIDALTSKAKEYIAKIADPSTLKGEKAELQKKVTELENEVRTMLEVHENEKRQLVERNESDQINFYLKDVAREFKLIDIPYKDTIIGQSISKSLQEHEVKPVLRDGKVVLVNAKDPMLAPKDGITFKAIIEKGFANDKLLDLGGTKPSEQGGGEEPKRNEFRAADPSESTLARNMRLAKQAVAAPVGS